MPRTKKEKSGTEEISQGPGRRNALQGEKFRWRASLDSEFLACEDGNARGEFYTRTTHDELHRYGGATTRYFQAEMSGERFPFEIGTGLDDQRQKVVNWYTHRHEKSAKKDAVSAVGEMLNGLNGEAKATVSVKKPRLKLALDVYWKIKYDSVLCFGFEAEEAVRQAEIAKKKAEEALAAAEAAKSGSGDLSGSIAPAVLDPSGSGIAVSDPEADDEASPDDTTATATSHGTAAKKKQKPNQTLLARRTAYVKAAWLAETEEFRKELEDSLRLEHEAEMKKYEEELAKEEKVLEDGKRLGERVIQGEYEKNGPADGYRSAWGKGASVIPVVTKVISQRQGMKSLLFLVGPLASKGGEIHVKSSHSRSGGRVSKSWPEWDPGTYALLVASLKKYGLACYDPNEIDRRAQPEPESSVATQDPIVSTSSFMDLDALAAAGVDLETLVIPDESIGFTGEPAGLEGLLKMPACQTLGAGEPKDTGSLNKASSSNSSSSGPEAPSNSATGSASASELSGVVIPSSIVPAAAPASASEPSGTVIPSSIEPAAAPASVETSPVLDDPGEEDCAKIMKFFETFAQPQGFGQGSAMENEGSSQVPEAPTCGLRLDNGFSQQDEILWEMLQDMDWSKIQEDVAWNADANGFASLGLSGTSGGPSGEASSPAPWPGSPAPDIPVNLAAPDGQGSPAAPESSSGEIATLPKAIKSVSFTSSCGGGLVSEEDGEDQEVLEESTPTGGQKRSRDVAVNDDDDEEEVEEEVEVEVAQPRRITRSKKVKLGTADSYKPPPGLVDFIVRWISEAGFDYASIISGIAGISGGLFVSCDSELEASGI
ncbi:hypothetical protein C8J56DRAFT_890955 [Mycena floridula]|nr:hypothetical protein C8J56DRAFT_890955 [Mycena floridula]